MNNTNRLKTLYRIRRLSRLMDTAIGLPGTKFRIGLDPILGIIPGAGDLVSTAFSAYIIILAARFNLPRNAMQKMIFNVALETVIGTVPLFGDLFDAFYKSNIRNLDILEAHLTANDLDLTAEAPVPSKITA